MQAGLRRAATGILPSRRIQDLLSINDGKGNGHSLIILLIKETLNKFKARKVRICTHLSLKPITYVTHFGGLRQTQTGIQ